MKKILALLLAFCLVMTVFAGCGDKIDDGPSNPNPSPNPVSGDNQPNNIPDNPDNPANPGNTSDIPDTWNGYDLSFVKDNGLEYIWNGLDNETKDNLASALTSIKNVDPFVPLNYPLDPDEEAYTFMQLMLNCAMDYPYVTNQVGRQTADGKVIALTLNFNFAVIQTEQDAWALTDRLNARLDEIVAGMPQGSQYEQIRYLHDTLVFNSRYSDETPFFYTAYGALIDGMATCQGYADAMHLLLSRAGYETCFCVGVGNNELVTHKWNYVKLDDGQWYILDPTWADPADKTDPTYISYDYFLVSDEVLLQDHKAKHESPYFTEPVATSMDMSYHVVEGYYCSTYEEAKAAIDKQIRDCAAEGRHYLYLRMSNEEVYNQVREDLLRANKADGTHGEIMQMLADIDAEIGANFNSRSWSVYNGHEDGYGPLTFIITLKYAE